MIKYVLLYLVIGVAIGRIVWEYRHKIKGNPMIVKASIVLMALLWPLALLAAVWLLDTKGK